MGATGEQATLVARLKAEIRRRADLIDADESQTVTFGRGGSGTPGLFIDPAGLLHWGETVARRWVATHRAEVDDHRIAMLRRQGELLARLDPA